MEWLDLKKLARELDELRERVDEAEVGTAPLDGDEVERLSALRCLEDELGDLHIFAKREGNAIPESEFEGYCRDTAEELYGDLGPLGSFVDWERYAASCRQDWREFEFEGTTYLVRA